jgi:hypothetical protein
MTEQQQEATVAVPAAALREAIRDQMWTTMHATISLGRAQVAHGEPTAAISRALDALVEGAVENLCRLFEEERRATSPTVPAAALDALMRAYRDMRTDDAAWKREARRFCRAVQPTWQPQPAETEES